MLVDVNLCEVKHIIVKPDLYIFVGGDTRTVEGKWGCGDGSSQVQHHQYYMQDTSSSKKLLNKHLNCLLAPLCLPHLKVIVLPQGLSVVDPAEDWLKLCAI